MRAPLRLATILLVASLLAGCTSEGNLGEIDVEQQKKQELARGTNLWESAAPSHRADVRIRGSVLDLEGTLSPLALPSVTLQIRSWRPDPIMGHAAPSAFALVGATHEGRHGWIIFNATIESTLEANAADPFTLSGHALHADGPALFARLAGSPAWTGMAPHGHEVPPARPHAWQNASEVRFAGLALPSNVTVHGANIEFFGTDGTRVALGAGTLVSTQGATLAALVANTPSILGATLDVPLLSAPASRWSGELTARAWPPSGEIALAERTESLALYNDATVQMRGGGQLSLTLQQPGPEWELLQSDVELVDILTGQTPRLAATLRLAPDVVDAVGPAGNLTRIKLILAETSRGADAHLTGYRIDASVRARYVGAEPFPLTQALFDLMNETARSPITAPALVGIGIALPFVALLEGVAGIFQALFPPSLTGPLEAGEAKVLTFDLMMPDTPRDVEILIEAQNADPARAIVRMQPTK